jgi:hypothetical protein
MLDLTISYKKNQGRSLSPSELLELYFYGIPMGNREGGKLSDDTIETYILAAQQEMEKYLNIKMAKQVIEEDIDFFMDDFRAWGFVRATFPVRKTDRLDGYVNTTKQIQYPPDWLSTRKSSDGMYFRHVYLVPVQTMNPQSNSVVYSGVLPHLGFLGLGTIPNYWKVRYTTGFDSQPMDLINMIGKLAAINILGILGDLLLGAGITSVSLGIDGLSQSISTPKSGQTGVYGARIKQYLDDLEKGLPRVSSYYKGIPVTSL